MERYADPFDLLRALNPVPDERALPATSAYVPAQRTLQQILARSRPPSRVSPWRGGGQRPRRRLVAVGVAAAVVTAVAAAGAWVLTRPADDPTKLACYAGASLDADSVVLAAGTEGDPVAACEEVWRTGPFRAWGTMPPLAGCVLEGGEIGVFPGDPSLCDRLGLARLATESGDWDARVTQLVDGLTASLAAPNCVDVAAAADLVRQRLDQLALDGWTLIAPAATVPGRPCASIAVDPPAKTITLVPVPLPGD